MKTLTARFPGKCDICDGAFPAGETIAYNGRASHVACVEEATAKLAREDAEDNARHAKDRADFLAGRRIRSTERNGEIVVTGAPSYADAAAEAKAFVYSVRAAGGKADWLVKKKNGKVTFGRELISYYGVGGGMKSHDGYAFPYRVAS